MRLRPVVLVGLSMLHSRVLSMQAPIIRPDYLTNVEVIFLRIGDIPEDWCDHRTGKECGAYFGLTKEGWQNYLASGPVDQINEQDQSMLHICVASGKKDGLARLTELFEAAEKRGLVLDVNRQDKTMLTPLDMALNKQHNNASSLVKRNSMLMGKYLKNKKGAETHLDPQRITMNEEMRHLYMSTEEMEALRSDIEPYGPYGSQDEGGYKSDEPSYSGPSGLVDMMEFEVDLDNLIAHLPMLPGAEQDESRLPLSFSGVHPSEFGLDASQFAYLNKHVIRAIDGQTYGTKKLRKLPRVVQNFIWVRLMSKCAERMSRSDVSSWWAGEVNELVVEDLRKLLNDDDFQSKVQEQTPILLAPPQQKCDDSDVDTTGKCAKAPPVPVYSKKELEDIQKKCLREAGVEAETVEYFYGFSNHVMKSCRNVKVTRDIIDCIPKDSNQTSGKDLPIYMRKFKSESGVSVAISLVLDEEQLGKWNEAMSLHRQS